MCVLVAIYVRNIQTGRLNPADLGFRFLLDLFLRKFVCYGAERKILQAAAESRSPIRERRSISAERFAINQNHVASRMKRRLSFRHLHRFLEGA